MKNKITLAVSVFLSILLFLAIILFLSRNDFNMNKKENSSESEATGEKILTNEMTEAETDEEKEPYVSQIDFDTLSDINTEVYAWLSILNTDMSFPVAQSETDDAYYLKHTIEGKYSDLGTLYTEKEYNTTSFDDPVTIIYGHQFPSGEMFGFLQRDFTEEEAFEKYGDIYVFCPDRELHYKAFAAVPYSMWHILDEYGNFTDRKKLGDFLERISEIDDERANFNPDFVIGENVTENDKILILETCLYGDDNGRYLVLGVLGETVD